MPRKPLARPELIEFFRQGMGEEVRLLLSEIPFKAAILRMQNPEILFGRESVVLLEDVGYGRDGEPDCSNPKAYPYHAGTIMLAVDTGRRVDGFRVFEPKPIMAGEIPPEAVASEDDVANMLKLPPNWKRK